MVRPAPLAAALAALLLGGCVTSRVLTEDPEAVIWFDGRPLGKSGHIWPVGPPHTARVLVVAKDGRRARTTVDREFSWFTFTAGLRTLGVCFVFCWTYPQNVVVPLPPRLPDVGWDADPAWDPWEAATDGSAWMRGPLERGEREISPRTSTSATATPTDSGSGMGQGTRDTGSGARAREPGHVDGHGHGDEASTVPVSPWSLPPHSGATP